MTTMKLLKFMALLGGMYVVGIYSYDQAKQFCIKNDYDFGQYL